MAAAASFAAIVSSFSSPLAAASQLAITKAFSSLKQSLP